MPPVADAVAAPLFPPKQVTFVTAEIVTIGAFGDVKTWLVILVQPFASVTVTVYVPDVRPLIDAVVALLLHL